MALKRSQAPSQINLYNEYISMLYSCEVSHDNITNLLLDANMLYGEASISEDIILNNFLSTYSALKGLSKDKSGTIVESFLSNDSFDKSFSLKGYLNIDTQNGDLTLPIDNTNTMKVESIIVSNESNGSPSEEYNDINSIINTSPSSLFIYEKTVNTISNVLVFDVSLRLKEEDYCNGLYIKLFSNDGSSYPKIDKVELSSDGLRWEEITVNLDINKADYFLRFTPISTKFIRVRLVQDSFSIINTSFGPRYKYSIGVRNILPKQTMYKIDGEYISTPFAINKTISSILFNKYDSGIVDYFISIDNGIKWEKIDINKLTPLYNFNETINSINSNQSFRIKIKMDKSKSIVNEENAEEFFSLNKNNKYITKNPASSIEGFIGGHISVGEGNPYKLWINSGSSINQSILEQPRCQVSDPKRYDILRFIPYYDGINDDIVLKINNRVVKNDRSIYSILKDSNKNNSILNIVSDELSKNGVIELSFKSQLHSHITNSSNVIDLKFPSFKLSKDNFTINTIKYSQDTIISNETISASGDIIIGYEPQKAFDSNINTYWQTNAKVIMNSEDLWFIQAISPSKQTIIRSYTIQAVYDDIGKSPNSLKLEGTNDNGSTWILIDSRDDFVYNSDNIAKFTIDNRCSFEGYRFKFYSNSDNSSICKVANINLYEAKEENLSKDEFNILSKDKIEIDKKSYNPQYDYVILYTPAFDITENISSINNKTVNIDINSNNSDMKLCLRYTYGNKLNDNAKKYYTPICNEYRIDII